MQSLLHLVAVFLLIITTHAAVLKSPMSNHYAQVAVLGCDSRKANLYYDLDRGVWVEHLASPCVNNEQSILEFCQQAYPSLRIGNIVRLDTVLSFENWCELTSPIDKNGNNIHRCKKNPGVEEIVQPFRCLYVHSAREEITLPALDCSMNSIIGTGECYRAEKWQQLAAVECSNRSMKLNHSIMTSDWCGLSSFRGIEFVCCPTKKTVEVDYETSPDEQDENTLLEDDPVPEQTPTHRRIIAMTLASREPSWMEDYRRWNNDPAYFADDEDANDNQPSIIATGEEQRRFNKDKETFKLKYKEQVDHLRIRWQQRQNEIQLLARRNASEAQGQLTGNENTFRREYDLLKETASRERTQLNEIHENHLDNALNMAKSDAYEKLSQAWSDEPLKTERIQDALYHYLQILLRDRIHLVNRYERLRAVDPEQAERKRVSIHDRLRLIVDRINEALKQLRQSANLQTKIQPKIDALFAEFDEVNQAAEKLLATYSATSMKKARVLSAFGRDEKKIYPFSSSTTSAPDDTNSDYDYATNEVYDDDDDDDDDENDLKSSSVKSTTTTATSSTTNENDPANYDQIETGESDWDTGIENEDNDKTDGNFALDLTNDEQNQQAFVNEKDLRPTMANKRLVRHFLVTYLPYAVGCLFLLCMIIGLLIFRFIKQNRLYGNHYEKNYVFTEVDSCTPEEKALHALQMNGYENPTYKYFESQTGKC